MQGVLGVLAGGCSVLGGAALCKSQGPLCQVLLLLLFSALPRAECSYGKVCLWTFVPHPVCLQVGQGAAWLGGTHRAAQPQHCTALSSALPAQGAQMVGGLEEMGPLRQG